jgi:NADPH:quinone reductase
MRALIATGRPEALVALDEAEQPRPQRGEALVKVDAFSVNRGEMYLLESRDPGWRPGKDIAGLVVRAAADRTGPAVGQRVTGHTEDGGWAEYAAVPVSSLAVIPESVSAIQAAALPLAGLTALRLLRLAGNVTGRRILLTGASGGVGHYLTELAAGAGAEVTAVTGSPARGRRLAELGAAEILHDVADARGPYHLVLESTGGKNLALAADRLAHMGTLIWFGQASLEPATLSFFDLRDDPGSVTIRQFSYWDFPASYGEDLAILARLVAAGRLHPEIGRIADWVDTAAVLTDLRRRRIRGNAVLTISPADTE